MGSREKEGEGAEPALKHTGHELPPPQLSQVSCPQHMGQGYGERVRTHSGIWSWYLGSWGGGAEQPACRLLPYVDP